MNSIKLFWYEIIAKKIKKINQQNIEINMLKGENLGYKAFKRFKRHKLALLSVIFLSTLIMIAIVVPIFNQSSVFNLNFSEILHPPSWKHPLGTDDLGRDVFARVIYGARVSLSVGIVAVCISTAIGIILGAISGYMGGKVDMLVMRFTDTIMCFPYFVIIMALVSVLGPSLLNTMLAIGFLSWPRTARITRGQFLYLKEKQFVEADKCLGIKESTIIFSHLLFNALSPVLVSATFDMANAILMESSLSFLGLGVQVPIPSWGMMLREASTLRILKNMHWMWIPPGIMITLTVLSINFIGDGLRDAMDPKMK